MEHNGNELGLFITKKELWEIKQVIKQIFW